jgi:hypothetical protein
VDIGDPPAGGGFDRIERDGRLLFASSRHEAAMRAIVIKEFGGPEVLAFADRPAPEPKPCHVVSEVKAFGLDHAEIYFRKGAWGEVAEISGIECVGRVHADPDRRFAPGQRVMALVGGMGRSINASYAQLVLVPASNVVAVDTDWHLPPDRSSSFAGRRVIATTRNPKWAPMLEGLGAAEVLLESPELAKRARAGHPRCWISADGTYKAKLARVFRFEDIQAAHRLMESNEAGGKIVVCV